MPVVASLPEDIFMQEQNRRQILFSYVLGGNSKDFAKYSRVCRKVHWLTNIFSLNVTKGDLLLNIAPLVV